MGTPQTNEMTVRLAREVVAQIAPDELADFDDTAKEFLGDPRQVRRAVKEREAEGAFGAGILVTIAPIVLTVSHEVVRFLMGPVVNAGLAALFKSFFAELINKFFKDTASKAKPPSSEIKLTPERLQAAKELGIKVAKELGLDDNRATLVVNIIIARVSRE